MGNNRIWLAILTVVVAAVAAFFAGRSVERSQWLVRESKLQAAVEIATKTSETDRQTLENSRHDREWWKTRSEEASADLKIANDEVRTERDKSYAVQQQSDKRLNFISPGLSEAVKRLIDDLHAADEEVWIAGSRTIPGEEFFTKTIAQVNSAVRIPDSKDDPRDPEIRLNHAAHTFSASIEMIWKSLYEERKQHGK